MKTLFSSRMVAQAPDTIHKLVIVYLAMVADKIAITALNTSSTSQIKPFGFIVPAAVSYEYLKLYGIFWIALALGTSKWNNLYHFIRRSFSKRVVVA